MAKRIGTILLLAAVATFSGCVSRTTTTEAGFGKETTTTETIWIWQSEFRNNK